MGDAINAKLYYPALITAMTLPDICASLESNGFTDDERYMKWFDENAAKHFGTLLTGEIAWYLRCSVLHNGRLSHPNFKTNVKEIMFVTDNEGFANHLIRLKTKNGKEYLVLELRKFCQAMYMAVIEWLKKVENTDIYKSNYKKYFNRNSQAFPFNEEKLSVIASFE